jgi:hypothetical protein
MNTSSPERNAITEELSGLIERVTFHNDDSGFCVLRVKIKGQREETTVVGSLPSVNAGEWLVAEGWWVIRQQNRAEQNRSQNCCSPCAIVKCANLGQRCRPAKHLPSRFGTNITLRSAVLWLKAITEVSLECEENFWHSYIAGNNRVGLLERRRIN